MIFFLLGAIPGILTVKKNKEKMTKNTEKASSAAMAYMRKQEESNLEYLSEQVAHLLGLEDFSSDWEKSESNHNEVQFTALKKAVSISIFILIEGTNITVSSSYKRKIGKVKFSVSVASQVAGILFGEWLEQLSELA